MLKELLNKTYQNFYVNDDNVIVGIETPKERWKIFEPELLRQYYIDTIAKCKALNTNFDPIKVKIAKYEKMLKQLENAMKKLKNNEI
jgi:hypothetical protein